MENDNDEVMMMLTRRTTMIVKDNYGNDDDGRGTSATLYEDCFTAAASLSIESDQMLARQNIAEL